MFKLDTKELDALIGKFKNSDKVEEIIEVEFLNMLSSVASNTVGDENHIFENEYFLLEGSVDYYVEDNQGYIVSEGLDYNEYVYYGSEKFNTSWAGDKWIENAWERDKEKELNSYQSNLTKALDGYLT